MHLPFSNVLLEPLGIQGSTDSRPKVFKSSPFIEKMPQIVKEKRNRPQTPLSSAIYFFFNLHCAFQSSSTFDIARNV